MHFSQGEMVVISKQIPNILQKVNCRQMQFKELLSPKDSMWQNPERTQKRK